MHPCSDDDPVIVHVVLALPPGKEAELEARLLQVSDPAAREHYGRHLTQQQITHLLNVPERQLDAVLHFLRRGSSDAADVRLRVSPHRDVVRAELRCADAAQLFDTQFYRFRHARTGATATRSATRYTLPPGIAPHISLVAGLLDFPPQRLHLARSAPMDGTKAADDARGGAGSAGRGSWDDCGGNCAGRIVPAVLQSQYGIPTASAPAASAGPGMALAEFASNWDQNGLDAFSESCKLAPGLNLTVDRTVGGNGPGICLSRHGGPSCSEAMLDITYIKALAGDIKLTDVFQREHFSIQEWALQLAEMADGDLPLVHSVSFGEDETELPSAAYMAACNVEFQKLGLRGASILVASGDGGVWGRGGATAASFRPGFPASSPFVTAVGGTVLATAGQTGNEAAWANSGGGFSNTFARPAYQEQAVSAYLSSPASSLPDPRLWNASGRAFPDVSALAGGVNAYCVSVDGKSFNGFTGTSASTPVWAAIVARLNGARLAKGGTALGFLNPLLYSSNASAFNDVTVGQNSAGTSAGFSAAPGWDAATGLGTPRFEALTNVM
eukprot:g3585.t1